MAKRGKERHNAPWWKNLLRTLLISVGTALVVRLVDALLYREESEG